MRENDGHIRIDSEYQAQLMDLILSRMPETRKGNDISRMAFSRILEQLSSMDYVFDFLSAETSGLRIFERVVVTEPEYVFIATHFSSHAQYAAPDDIHSLGVSVFDNKNGFSLFNSYSRPSNVGTTIDNNGLDRGIPDPQKIPMYWFGDRGQIGIRLSRSFTSARNYRYLVSGIKISRRFLEGK